MRTLPVLRLLSAKPSRTFRETWQALVRTFEAPWVAYGLLLILQIKIVWGIWSYRDVSVGDTTSYFVEAWRWYTTGKVNFAWSPLYTAFYGSFLFLNPDPVWATFAHRVVIVVAAAGLVLAVFRQFLPPAIAWLCATWWTILPIVFNTLYEVHLFAVLPVLVAWLLLFTARGPWRRAVALSVLGTAAILVRNELSVPFGLLGLVLTAYEWRRTRRGTGPGLGLTVTAYATALGTATGICAAAYAASNTNYPELAWVFKCKHTVNMAQVYAFGYQQRNPEWKQSPWLECYGLMRDHFGKPAPSLREMIIANPRAVREHFVWNLSLSPSGLQLLLFNRASGTVNPDYGLRAVRCPNSSLAGVLSGGLLMIWAIGLMRLWRDRWELWSEGSSARALGWAAMFTVAAVVPLVIMTQRPRPSYLFAFGVFLIAVTGTCFHTATFRRRLSERLRMSMPLIMVGFVLFAPRYFQASSVSAPSQPIGDAVKRLWAHRAEIAEPGTRLAVPSFPIGRYAHPLLPFAFPQDQFHAAPRSRLFEVPWLLDAMEQGETISGTFARYGIDYVYLDESSLTQIQERGLDQGGHFAADREIIGWQLIDGGDRPGDRWRLYRRAK